MDISIRLIKVVADSWTLFSAIGYRLCGGTMCKLVHSVVLLSRVPRICVPHLTVAVLTRRGVSSLKSKVEKWFLYFQLEMELRIDWTGQWTPI